MVRKEIEEKVIGILVDVLFVDEEDCRPDKRLVIGLGADSLDIVDISMALERKFGIKMSEEDVDSLGSWSVKEICDYIENAL